MLELLEQSFLTVVHTRRFLENCAQSGLDGGIATTQGEPIMPKKPWEAFDSGITLSQVLVLLTAYVLLITDLASNPVIGW